MVPAFVAAIAAAVVVTAAPAVVATAAAAQPKYPDFTQLIADNQSAVVSISALGKIQTATSGAPSDDEDSPFHDYFKRFFEDDPQSPRRGSPSSVGSGFIISADGYVLTNAHVIEDNDNIVVGLSDRSELAATVVGTDPRTDVALLKVDSDDLPAVTIGDPNALIVGEWVLAIGSPFGFNYTATQGIISGLSRSLPSNSYVPFIQTDAAVNPGNSGGPLFNLNGEVIGINSQIYSRTGGYQGVSFAIPIDFAMDVAEQLKQSGRVARGWLGVIIGEVTADISSSLGLQRPRGALIKEVLEQGPAAKGGLLENDVIIVFNDLQVASSTELPPLVGRVRPGSSAAVVILRDGEQRELQITIEELPERPRQRASVTSETPTPAVNRLKLTVTNAGDGDQTEGDDGDGVGQGVVVSAVEDGPAAAAGIEPGDVILRLNNQRIDSVEQFEQLVAELPAGKPLPVLIQRGDGALFLALTLP